MVQNPDQKKKQILEIIRSSILKYNTPKRIEPGLYFYRKVFDLRNEYKYVEKFLKKEYHIEMLYATLISWGMNSRRAEMEYFEQFKDNIFSNLENLKLIDRTDIYENTNDLDKILRKTYDDLKIMKSNSKLVSNSKLLHFFISE